MVNVIIAFLVIGSVIPCGGATKEGGSVTWITPKPTQAVTDAPTYQFPSTAPVSIQLLSSTQPSAQPPFFTSLPTKAPTKSSTFTGSKPSKVPTAEGEKPKLFNASKSSKDAKASKPSLSNQNDSPVTNDPTPSMIQSPTFTPFEPKDFTTTPSIAPQQLNSSSPSCRSAKWHPDIGFSKCTNNHEYPEDWSASPDLERHYFRSTLQQCCEFVFGPIGVCEFEDVCSVTSPSMLPSDSPSSRPSGSPSRSMTVSVHRSAEGVVRNGPILIYIDSEQQLPSLLPSVSEKELGFPTANPSAKNSQVRPIEAWPFIDDIVLSRPLLLNELFPR